MADAASPGHSSRAMKPVGFQPDVGIHSDACVTDSHADQIPQTKSRCCLKALLRLSCSTARDAGAIFGLVIFALVAGVISLGSHLRGSVVFLFWTVILVSRLRQGLRSSFHAEAEAVIKATSTAAVILVLNLAGAASRNPAGAPGGRGCGHVRAYQAGAPSRNQMLAGDIAPLHTVLRLYCLLSNREKSLGAL